MKWSKTTVVALILGMIILAAIVIAFLPSPLSVESATVVRGDLQVTLDGEGITRVRGQWQRLKVGDREIPVMPTFHPAYVLRQYTQEVRRAVWADLQAAKAWVDRPQG